MITITDGGTATWEVVPSADLYLAEVRLGDAFLNTRAGSFVERNGAALESNGTLRFRFDTPMTQPLTVHAHEHDLGQANPGDGLKTVTVHLWYKDGTRALQSQLINVDRSGQRAYAVWLRAGETGGYVRFFDAPNSTKRLRVVWPSGATRSAPVTSLPDGLTFFRQPELADPSGVYFIDTLGAAGANILARASGSSPTRARTPLIPWPLPPWLNPEAEGVKPLLKAAETGLNLAVDALGGEINPTTASGRFLDLFAEHFGLAREPRETDAELRARLFNALRMGKTSPDVLAAILSELLATTVEVVDNDTDFNIAPGRMNLYFYGEPKGGLEKAADTVRRYRAAGIVPSLAYSSAPRAAYLSRRLTLYGEQAFVTEHLVPLCRSPYTLNNTWRLDGTVPLGAGRFTWLTGGLVQGNGPVPEETFLQAEYASTEYVERKKAPPMFGMAVRQR